MDEHVAHGALRAPKGELIRMAPATGQRISPAPVFTIAPVAAIGVLASLSAAVAVLAGLVVVMVGFGAGLVTVYPSRSAEMVTPAAVKLCPVVTGLMPGTVETGPVLAWAGSAAAANSAIAAVAPVTGIAASARDRSVRPRDGAAGADGAGSGLTATGWTPARAAVLVRRGWMLAAARSAVRASRRVSG
ncbi:hypothetical protein, partial [Curtobacterium citreum]